MIVDGYNDQSRLFRFLQEQELLAIGHHLRLAQDLPLVAATAVRNSGLAPRQAIDQQPPRKGRGSSPIPPDTSARNFDFAFSAHENASRHLSPTRNATEPTLGSACCTRSRAIRCRAPVGVTRAIQRDIWREHTRAVIVRRAPLPSVRYREGIWREQARAMIVRRAPLPSVAPCCSPNAHTKTAVQA